MSSDECPSLAIGSVFLDRFKIIKKLGGGSFGKVYEVQNVTDGVTYALKTETSGTINSVLKVEATIMKSFLPKQKHFVRFIDVGRHENMNYIVMSPLGRNLSELLSTRPKRRFNLQTVIRIGAQCLQALQDLHELGYVHRDVKPSNLAIGRHPYHRCVYIFDFGLSRKFIVDGIRIKPRHRAPFRGTSRYATINAHEHIEQGPHDDLGSMIYALIEMLHGRLPWGKEKNDDEILFRKLNISEAELFRGFPTQMAEMFGHLKTYNYDTMINYKYFHRQFSHIIKSLKIDINGPFEWEVNPGRQRSAQPI